MFILYLFYYRPVSVARSCRSRSRSDRANVSNRSRKINGIDENPIAHNFLADSPDMTEEDTINKVKTMGEGDIKIKPLLA